MGGGSFLIIRKKKQKLKKKRIRKKEGKKQLTLIVESVNTVDAGALVVSTENEEVLWVLDLVGEEEADGLETLLATVDIVPEEEVIRLGREAAVLEEAQKVVVLPVNVSANLDGGLKLEEDGLADENLTGLGAQELDFVLGQVHLLAGAAATHFQRRRKEKK